MVSVEKSSQPPLTTPSPRRKPVSVCKCLAWSIGIPIVLLGGWFLVTLAQTIFQSLRSPHAAYYQNATIDEVKNKGTVVQPLVDSSLKFDIGVSVWVEDVKGQNEDSDSERPLFSDIVFKGLPSNDSLRSTTVNFRMPNAYFHQENLTNYDLRASFVLIPTSTSPLDRLKNISSWRPDFIKVSRMRTSPFPMRLDDTVSSGMNNGQMLVDAAIDSFGISEPLIQFHTIRSKCGTGEEKPEAIDEEDEEEDEDDPPTTQMDTKPSNGTQITLLKSTEGQPPLKAHPYIVTRTHLRLIREERLFNRKAYNRAHTYLKSASCGQKITKEPNQYLCIRNFGTNGVFGTRFEVDAGTEGGKNRSEWFYAPFLSVYQYGASPMDMKPIDINRETDCVTGETDPEYTDVEWKVSFTSISSLRLAVADVFGPGQLNVSQSDYKLSQSHKSAELINGIHGHRYNENSHPRRRLVLNVIRQALSFLVLTLNGVYWYTRTSTYGLSILGISLVASGRILDSIIFWAASYARGKENAMAIISFIGENALDPTSFMQLRTVLRLEIGWRSEGSWIPAMWRLPATHRERASERLEAQTPLAVRGGIFVAVAGLCFIFNHPQTEYLIAPLHPLPTPADLSEAINISATWSWILTSIGVTGNIFQCLFNQRARLFSGQYKSAAILEMIASLMYLILFAESIVGRIEGREGFLLYEGFMLLLSIWKAWQACVFESVKKDVDDEDSE